MIKTLTEGTIIHTQDQIIYCLTKIFWPKVFIFKFWFMLDIFWFTVGVFITTLTFRNKRRNGE